MNDTATAGGATGASLIPSTTDAFTIAHLVVIAIFAVAVIAAIVWGARLKRRRKTAERDIANHNSIVEQASPSVPEEPAVTTPDPVASTPTPTSTAVPSPVNAPAAAEFRDEVPAEPVGDGLADEPIAASAPLEAAPAAEAASVRVTGNLPADASVSTLKGLGPKLATRLGELGITTVGQVAALSDEDAARLDAQLGPFSGRMTRDRWIEQARFLAAGDTAGFEAVFGRL